MAYESKNPYTGEVMKTFADATDAEVLSAIDKAHHTFRSCGARRDCCERSLPLTRAC